MGKRFNDNLVPGLLVLAVLVVSFNVWLALRSIDVMRESEDWVQHTWQVINLVERVVSTARDAGLGNLSYMLTGDEAYVRPFAAAREELPRELDELDHLTRDNASQQVRIPLVRAVIDQRLSLLAGGIELRRSGATNVAEAVMTSDRGREQLERLRVLGDAMEQEERRLLDLRVKQTQKSTQRARVTVGLASFLDFLLIVLMLRLIGAERVLRRKANDTAESLAASRTALEVKTVEVLALNQTLEERVRQRTAELETTNRELEAFSYSVSHDLRAPLRTIDGFSLALEEDYAEAVDVVGKDYIKRVRTGVQRMGELIDALLQLSRITRATIERESFSLSDLAQSVAADLQEQNKGRDLSFEVHPNCFVQADPGLMRVALENLLGNAVKFSAKVPHAVVEFGWDAAQKAWFVRDNGAGFDMYYSEKLFNAFNRLHGDKDFKGSGIGLATVARVIRRHHGTIWADSVVGHGATFWFTLG